VSLESYIRAAPKAELHVHLEGAIRPATALELARRNGVELPFDDVAGFERLLEYRDFADFISVIRAVSGTPRTVDEYERIVYELGEEMARQQIRYAEVTTSPSVHELRGVPLDVYFAGLQAGRARARAEFGVEIAWIIDIVRAWSDPSRTTAMAEYTTAAAIAWKDDGAVALGLAGPEEGAPPEPFAPWFERARAAGLRSVPHAGEHAGPASIRGALTALAADRIAHGVLAIEDPSLVAELVARQVPLDVAPTSNVRLGVYPDYASHPLPELLTAGATITINSDDPPLFGTTLTDELLLLATRFGLDVQAIDALILNAVRHSFQPAEQRRAMEAAFERELTALKAEHLGTNW
jgi:aminodeoxyfutalosine deaminase